MVDALEAERSASKKKVVRVDAADFVCEEPAQESRPKRRRRAPRPPDEPAP
jgi:hypothetical protein